VSGEGSTVTLLAANEALHFAVAFVHQDSEITAPTQNVVSRAVVDPPNAVGRRGFLRDGNNGLI
jgi:hypothetical protein